MLDPKYLPHYTVEDYRRWEGDWELIEGIPYAMVPSPTFRHQRIALKIARQLDEALEECPSCHAVCETDWIAAKDTVFRPDVMVLCDPVEGDYPTKPPRLIVEVLSPATKIKDEGLKRELYARFGVNHYLIADPDRETLLWLELEGLNYLERQRWTPESGDVTLEVSLGECEVALKPEMVFQK